MGLKNGSSTGVDCVDVRYVLSAFETLNQCKLSVLIRLSGTEARPVMDLEVQADPLESAAAEPAPLGLVKSVVGSTGARTLEAAILQALYSLDAQLAAGEFARADNK
jgi:hypothetical protein